MQVERPPIRKNLLILFLKKLIDIASLFFLFLELFKGNTRMGGDLFQGREKERR